MSCYLSAEIPQSGDRVWNAEVCQVTHQEGESGSDMGTVETLSQSNSLELVTTSAGIFPSPIPHVHLWKCTGVVTPKYQGLVPCCLEERRTGGATNQRLHADAPRLMILAAEVLNYCSPEAVRIFSVLNTLLSSVILRQVLFLRIPLCKQMELMSIISQIYVVGIGLQAHCNHVWTLLHTENLELPLLEVIICNMQPCKGFCYGGGSRVMVLIMHLFFFFSQSESLFCLMCTALCPSTQCAILPRSKDTQDFLTGITNHSNWGVLRTCKSWMRMVSQIYLASAGICHEGRWPRGRAWTREPWNYRLTEVGHDRLRMLWTLTLQWWVCTHFTWLLSGFYNYCHFLLYKRMGEGWLRADGASNWLCRCH